MEKRKIHIILCVCVFTILFSVGYIINNNNAMKVTSPSTIKADTSTKTTILHTPSTLNSRQVDGLIKQLNSEKQVLSSQIYIKNNIRWAVITFKKDADNKNAQEFATKYAELIKKAYNNKNVNVQIIKNGKNIANVIFK